MKRPELGVQVYSRKELAADGHPFFKKPKETLKDGGFIVYDDKFLSILGPNPIIEVIAHDHSYPFAHKAGVYIPSTGEVFIPSNHIRENRVKKIQISKIKKEASDKYVVEEIEPGVIFANGAVNHRDCLLFCEQGSFTHPGALTLMSTTAPYKTTPF